MSDWLSPNPPDIADPVIDKNQMRTYIKILLFILISLQLYSQEQLGVDILGENPNDDFGSTVAISEDGSIIAIGAHRRNSGRGIIEVYQNESGVWKLKGNKINGFTDNSWFGTQVAMTPTGNRLIVGAYKENITRIFDFINNDWKLTGEISLGLPSWGIHFGHAVDISIDGKTVAISATHHPQSNVHRGIVNIYKEINNSWQQLGEGIQGEFEKDQSGWDIDLSVNGNLIAIGSISNKNMGEGAGQVRIFSFDNTSWNQIGKSLHGEHQHLSFGWNLDMSENGKYLIVGAPIDWTGTQTELHYAEIFEFNNGDWNTKGSKIYGLPGNNFGYDVAISDDGERVAISVPQDKNCPIQIYDFIGSNWELVGSISHEAENHSLGISIAMNPSGKVLMGTSRTAGGFAVIYDLNELDGSSCLNEQVPEEKESIKIYFPNIIRLNSTNPKNSYLYGQSKEEKVYSLSVFDRWGNLIFENQNAYTNSKEDGWKPSTEFSPGLYVYLVKYKIKEKIEIMTRDITLIR